MMREMIRNGIEISNAVHLIYGTTVFAEFIGSAFGNAPATDKQVTWRP